MSSLRHRVSVSVALAGVTAAGIVVVSSATAQASGNLVGNPGFESGITGWAATGNGSPHLSRVRGGHSGKYAAELTNKNGGATVLNDRPNAVTSTTASGAYTASAWVRTKTPNTGVAVRLTESSASSGSVGTNQQYLYLTDTAWHYVSMAYTAASAGDQLDLNVWAPGLQAGHSFDVDDIVLTVATPSGQTSTSPSASPSPSSSPTAAPTVAPATSTSPTPMPVVTQSPTPSPTQTSTATPTPAPQPTATCTVTALLVPTCGAWWGVYKHPDTGETWSTAITNLESAIGRKFDILYRYHDFSGSGTNGNLVDSYEQPLGVNGRILMDTWTSRVWATNTTYTWADIAAGKYDSTVIDPQALRVKQYGKPIMLSFDHEMDAVVNTSKGTAADYVAAFRHIHDRFAALGVTNVIWVWTVEGYSGHNSLYPSLYPGSAFVDWIAYDPYNFYTCHNTAWKTPTQTIDPEYQWLMNNGFGNKPFMLAEYGTVPDPANATAAGDWYRGVPSALANHPNIKAVLEWDSSASGPNGTCDTRLSNPATLAGFTQAGQAAYVTH